MPRGRKAKDYPYWEYQCQRAFREAKRAELRKLAEALGVSTVAFGYGYLPGPPIDIIDTWVRQKREACSIKRWGRG